MMSDPLIHQLYCTHCTFGTSALHRHTGNLKDEPFEYSTRAGSCTQSESHLKFQQIEKQYFYGLPLPSDATSDQRKRLTAATSAWRRLIAVPLPTGQLVAQVCYRTTDTSKPPRTGSYFAHVLLHESDQPAWTLTDALQMWGASFWQTEDSADIDYDLKTISRLKDLRGFQSVINDAVLLSFLTTPVGGHFTDGEPGATRDEPAPRCAIPSRWRGIPADIRQEWFAAVFHAVANLNLERRDRLLVAVEPSMAALFYYGVLRMLPLTGLVEQLSVSTFEPHDDPTATVLTATDFADPRGSEQYLAGNRANIVNTYVKSPPPVTRSGYFERMLSRFIAEQGGHDVDRIRNELRAVGKLGLSTLKDCEQYFVAEDLVTRLLQANPAKAVSEKEIAGLKLDTARQKLRQALLARLAATPSNAPLWTELAQSASRTMAILHLLAEEPELEGSGKVLARLCDGLPQNELPRFLDDATVGSQVKLDRLQREVIATSQLPPGCDSLWSPAKPSTSGERPLLEQLIDKLDVIRLKMFCEKVIAAESNATSPRIQILLTYVTRAASKNASKQSIVTSYLGHESRTEEQWDVLLGNHELRSALFEVCPTSDATLRDALVNQLDRLLESGSRFSAKLEILKGIEARIPDERRAELACWGRVRSRLKELNELQQQSAGFLDLFGSGNRRRRFHEIGSGLGNEFHRILRANYGDQSITQQMHLIKPLLRANSSTGTLPEPLTRGISDYLRSKDSTVVALTKKSEPSLASKAISWTPIVVPVALVVAMVVIVFRTVYFASTDTTSVADADKGKSAAKGAAAESGKDKEKEEKEKKRASTGENVAGTTTTGGGTDKGAGAESVKDTPAAPKGGPAEDAVKVSALEPVNKTPAPAAEQITASTAKPAATGGKPKAADWLPDMLYFADEGDPIKLSFASWPTTETVSFLTLHGPDLYRSEARQPAKSDASTWPLVVEWKDDTTISISAQLPAAPPSTPALTPIWVISTNSQLVVAKPPSPLDELMKASPDVFEKITASLRNCVLGIHFGNGTKRFYTLDHAQSAVPLKGDPKELLFHFGGPGKSSGKDKRPWALSGDAELNIGSQNVYLGDGNSKSLMCGSWELTGWPETSLLKGPKLVVKDGAAVVTVVLKGEFAKVDAKTYEFRPLTDEEPSSDVVKLKSALNEASKGFKQMADDFDSLQRTFLNDPDYRGKLNRLERTKMLCQYLGESPPVARQFPTGSSTQLPMQVNNWINSTNSEIDKLKSNISKQRRNKEKNLLESLREGIDQITIVGTVYRVYGAFQGTGAAGEQIAQKNPPGIAVKVIEYKKPPKQEEAKDKKP